MIVFYRAVWSNSYGVQPIDLPCTPRDLLVRKTVEEIAREILKKKHRGRRRTAESKIRHLNSWVSQSVRGHHSFSRVPNKTVIHCRLSSNSKNNYVSSAASTLFAVLINQGTGSTISCCWRTILNKAEGSRPHWSSSRSNTEISLQSILRLQVRRKSFEEKRRKHYNEFDAVRRMREKMKNLKDDDEEDADMDE